MDEDLVGPGGWPCIRLQGQATTNCRKVAWNKPIERNLQDTGSSQPHNDSAQVEFVLVLTQNGQSLQGDAAITSGKSRPIHIPITTGVIGQDGKLTLAGEANYTIASAHLNFDGKAESGKITGTVDLSVGNVGGGADHKGALILTQAS